MSRRRENKYTWGGESIPPTVRSSKRANGIAGRRRLETDLSAHPILALRSDRLLAQDYGISVLTVNRARRKLEADGSIPETEWRICRNGTQMNLARKARVVAK